MTTLGRPGHGAPLRTPTGQTLAYIRSDPIIRFQSHDLARGAVENDLRYKSSPLDKENYRKELGKILFPVLIWFSNDSNNKKLDYRCYNYPKKEKTKR